MFIDRVRIRVTAGSGGNGCCSFRREKYVPRGGPNGGDGGDGGSVYFEADARYTSLLDLKYHAHWTGERGAHGRGSDCHGRRGREHIIPVPCGTIIRDFETGEVCADLTEEGQRHLAARGGKGGRGNARFVSPTRRVPRFAELGEPGEDAEYLLELKLIAEVGMVGLPNAGKSTLLSVLTAAHPKIADYPFTTLSPNLGVAGLSGFRTLTLADIPGIIEGAAQGKGLGHDFLRHIERTKVLLFLIDLGDEDPVATYETLENELYEHSDVFAKRPRLIAFNKADVTENRARFEEVSAGFDEAFLISAATREGVDALLERLWEAVDRVREEEAEEGPEEEAEREYTYEAPYTISQEAGGYRIEGRSIVQAVKMTNFDNEEAIRYLHHKFQRMGLFKALKRMGAQDGQALRIEDVEFEYHADD